MEKQQRLTESADESPDGSRSESLPSGRSSPWWASPERAMAVAGAIYLRSRGSLAEEWTAIVLVAALGGPMAAWLFKRLRR